MKIAIALVCVFLAACGGSQIAKEEYSQLATPNETFDFVKKSVEYDDPEAFYYCLADYIKTQVPLSQITIAWSLAGNMFGTLLRAELQNVEIPAPDFKNEKRFGTAKMTVTLGDLEAAFLLVRKEKQWKIGNPTHYDLPDISQLPQPKKLPWRTLARGYYTNSTKDWNRSKENNTLQKRVKKVPKTIPWRQDTRDY